MSRIRSDLTRLLENSGKVFSSNMLVVCVQFAKVILLTRFLSGTGYGKYVAIIAFAESVNQFFDVRVAETATRYGTEYKASGDSSRLAAVFKVSYGISLTTGILGFALVVASADWAARTILHDPDVAGLIRLYAVVLLVATPNSTANAALRVMDRFGWMSVFAAVSAATEFVVLGVVLFAGGGLSSVIAVLLIKAIVATLASVFLAGRALAPLVTYASFCAARPRLLSDRYGELRRFVFSTNFIAYARMATTKLDVLFLSYFRSPEEVGIYKAGLQLASATARLTDPLIVTILPDLTRLRITGQVQRLRRLVRRASALAAMVLLPVAATTVVLRVPLVTVLFGEAFLPASSVVAIAVWGFAVAGVFFWLWPAFLSFGRPDVAAWIAGPGAFLHLALMCALVPALGGVGAATSYLLTQLLMHAVSLVFFYRLLMTEERKAFIAKDALATGQ